jgi:hypothetical protein
LTDEQFIDIIDELCLSNDKDLKMGLKWIDQQARKKGIPFYEMAEMIVVLGRVCYNQT